MLDWMNAHVAFAAAIGLAVGVTMQAVVTTQIGPRGTFALDCWAHRLAMWLLSAAACTLTTLAVWHETQPPALVAVSCAWGLVSPLAAGVAMWVVERRWPGLLRSVKRHASNGND